MSDMQSKKKWLFFGFVLCGVCLASLFLIPKFLSVDKVPSKKKSYFFSYEITSFAPWKVPYVVAKIENQKVSLLLDLGYSEDVALIPAVVEQLKEKTYLEKSQHYGFRGKSYDTTVYKIPKLQIENLSFLDLSLDEEWAAYQEDSYVNPEQEPIIFAEGKLGWHLFTGSNLFLDLSHSKIAFSDSIRSVKKNGYQNVVFVKVPLLRDRRILEIEAEVNGKKTRCLLDTGATCNLINTELEGSSSAGEAEIDLTADAVYNSFTVNRVVFDPLILHPLPIRLPFHIDIILGMEFFREHIVFIDFAENSVYIAQSTQ